MLDRMPSNSLRRSATNHPERLTMVSTMMNTSTAEIEWPLLHRVCAGDAQRLRPARAMPRE
jgi:hypothetical protein